MADNKFYSKFEKKQTSSKEKQSTKYPEKKSEHKSSVKKTDTKTEQAHIKAKVLQSLFCTSSISKESLDLINNFDEIIQGVRPLNSKQMQQLPDNIRQLSHQLTDQRSTRRLGYMNESIQLSSYVRYYTWWNLVRLVRLFSNLPSSAFPANDQICLDLGSGPLTVVIALWIARKELREKKLTWYCLDVSSASMALGEDIFLSVAAKTDCEPWKIIRVKGPFGTQIKQKCGFITCANMLNELDQASDMPPEFQTKKYFEQLNAYATKDASFILVEPGVPKSARTLALLRQRFLASDKQILAPCPHADDCPMNGFKAYTGSQNKWCNFAFATTDAPAKLQKLSVLAKLPKERATLSFLCVGPETEEKSKNNEYLQVRINSDQFRLPQNKSGFYGCSSLGLTLISTRSPEAITSGDLISISQKKNGEPRTDEKSGAQIIEI